MPRELRALANAISVFREHDPEIQAQAVLTFLFVAMAHAEGAEDLLMQDIKRKLNVEGSSVTRNVQLLSAWDRKGKRGYNLVEKYVDQGDRRNMRVRLTRDGIQMASRLADIVR